MIIKKYQLLSLSLIGLTAVTSTSLAAESSSLTGNGEINFKVSDFETPPVDPENPEKQVDPGNEITKTTGLLRFDVIPRLHFGPQEISNKNQVYEVNAQLFKDDTSVRPNYLQITDNRANFSGWEVSVRQETVFKNTDTKNSILKGSVLSFDKQWINSAMPKELQPTVMKDAIEIEEIGASYPIATAEKGKGAGTWIVAFGSTGEVEGQSNTLTPLLNAEDKPVTDASFNNKPIYKNSGIKLFVPGATQKDPVKYKTVLTWTVSELS